MLLGRGFELTSLYKITKLPHLFILDQQGVIRASERFLKADEIKAVVDGILATEKN